jgi:hypothetical protein
MAIIQNLLKLIRVYRKPTASVPRRISSFDSFGYFSHAGSDLIEISRYAISILTALVPQPTGQLAEHSGRR